MPYALLSFFVFTHLATWLCGLALTAIYRRKWQVIALAISIPMPVSLIIGDALGRTSERHLDAVGSTFAICLCLISAWRLWFTKDSERIVQAILLVSALAYLAFAVLAYSVNYNWDSA